MFLKALYLRNFRNYAEAEISFQEGINPIVGDNAQGKTNLLEAIYLVSTGRSFRTQVLGELIRQGESFFYLEASVVHVGLTQKVQISFDGQNRRLQMDANTYSSFQPLLGTLPLVLYTPQDTELITGAPAVRRRFFNLHLAQSDPLYVHHLSRFWRAMQQRNCLLRQKAHKSLDCWEAEMALSGAYLQQTRSALVQELRGPLSEKSSLLSGKQEIHELRFHPSYPSTSEAYLQQLQKHRGREMDLGLTLTGPHRDDFTLLIEGKPARFFASEGQKKTAIAALRFAEWERLRERMGFPPLMGIDDLGLHLDEKRLKTLQDELGQLGQVFVTTPLPGILFPNHRPITIVQGTLSTLPQGEMAEEFHGDAPR